MFQWQDDTDILAGQQANTTQHAIPPEKQVTRTMNFQESQGF